MHDAKTEQELARQEEERKRKEVSVTSNETGTMQNQNRKLLKRKTNVKGRRYMHDVKTKKELVQQEDERKRKEVSVIFNKTCAMQRQNRNWFNRKINVKERR